jgi:hypothetical protein
MKLKISTLPTAVDKTGVEPLGNFTEAGHVAVNEPTPPCVMAIRKLDVVPLVAGFENVNVVLPVRVIFTTLTTAISTVNVPVTVAFVVVTSR